MGLRFNSMKALLILFTRTLITKKSFVPVGEDVPVIATKMRAHVWKIKAKLVPSLWNTGRHVGADGMVRVGKN